VASSLQLAEPVKAMAAKAARRAPAGYGSARQQFGRFALSMRQQLCYMRLRKPLSPVPR